MLARLFKLFLAVFVSLFAMWGIFVVYFLTASLLFPLSSVSNAEALVIFIVGVSISLLSGVLVARWIYRSMDRIFLSLGKEEAELRQWVRQFHNVSNTQRVVDSNNPNDSNDRVDPPPSDNNPTGPGNSRAKRFSLHSSYLLQ